MLHQISLRETRYARNHRNRGSVTLVSKWTDTDRENFRSLIKSLQEQRKYENSDVIISAILTPPKPPVVIQSSLFSLTDDASEPPP